LSPEATTPETPEEDYPTEAIIDLPRDRETGLRVGRVTIFGPVGSGKTEIACALARMMAPESLKEKYILSPVATAANRLPDFQWFKIDPTDKKKVEAFMASINEKRAFLLLDEADAYFGGSGRTYGTPSMFGAVNWGRNFCLSMIVIAHGTAVAPKNLIENSQAVLIFRTTTPGLLDYAEEYMQDQIGDYVGDVRHTLTNLKQYVALVYAPLAEEKFVGFAKLDLATGEIAIWKPSPQDQDEEPKSTTPSSNEPEEDGGPSASPIAPEATSLRPERPPNG